MHFWIDKRSSQLHNYGGGSRGRIPGPGGFYTRTFGSRHRHPPPLIRSASSANSSSSSRSHNNVPLIPTTTTNNVSSHHNGHNNPMTTVPAQMPVTASVNHNSSSGHSQQQHSSPHLNMNPMDNMNMINNTSIRGGNYQTNHHIINTNTSTPPYQQNTSLRLHGMRHMGGPQGGMGNFIMTSQAQHPSVGNPNEMVNYMSGADPVIGLSGGGMGSSGVSGRHRPRSYSHSASGPGPPSRRRSSSSLSSGGFNHRRSSVNRWTYDPYNISHHQQLRHSHQAQMWPDGRQGYPDETANNRDISPNAIVNAPRISGLSSDPQVHSGTVLGTSTTSTSTHSIVDPSWKRTKRIGLTLCFMAFILMSTVAAKFVIEGPWLIDKTPRNERTEATIYFFLTEVIFVVFAMGLFFVGVTCLRKRTNAYLLRQFNDYILQTSPHETGSMGSPDYFLRRSNGDGGEMGGPNSQHQTSHTGRMSSTSNIDGSGGRPSFFGPHFLPSLENHLANMHISVAESPNLVMNGLSKPPPYHIALYLPIPDEHCELPGTGTNNETTTPESNNKLRRQSTQQQQQPQQQSSQSSSWISSTCLTVADADETLKTDDDSNDDNNEEQDVESRPKRKRRKNEDESNPDARSETPPPPYGQLM